MKYTVIKFFTDLQDNNHAYNVGDEYPHVGAKKPSKERIEELSSNKNRQNCPLIKAVETETVKEEKPKTTKKKSTKND